MRIIDHSPEHQAAFKRINVAWIAKDHVVEAVDLEVLDHPERNIIAPGGCILLATADDGTVVGTCALLKSSEGVYQMVKMAVDEASRGKGIGRLLCDAILTRARHLQAHKVILYSNTTGSAVAIRMYRQFGFQERPLPTKAYVRANIYMELDLDPSPVRS